MTALRLLLGVAALCVAAPGAHAVDIIDLMDWACDGQQAGAVRESVIEACGGEEDTESREACDIVSGTPFACNNYGANGIETEVCSSNSVEFEVSGDVGSGLGWEVTGSLSVSASIAYTLSGNDCQLTPLQPPPDGEVGEYVVMRGTANLKAEFEVSGTGTIKFLGLTIVGIGFEESCSEEVDVPVYETDTTAACVQRIPPKEKRSLTRRSRNAVGLSDDEYVH